MKYFAILFSLGSVNVNASEYTMNYWDAFEQYQHQRYTNDLSLPTFDKYFSKVSKDQFKKCGLEDDRLIAVISISGDGSIFEIFPKNGKKFWNKFLCYSKSMKGENFPKHEFKRYYLHTGLR